ncbi:PTS mannose/fructose/sorbose/N-acetylgalactosamine transporter subunit IIC [Enterococcus asini]|uniref:PTS mannose/fructose/sorbose/N-acetylgalactosamine transporter subunit IIC n=1 Tax=Enterococcus asini TaxID=57732 RepID=UPI0013871CF0|nr:PTS sugar transporter subunit IIC [Enterococcus asini]MDT2745107.1 PTS sugar transporter subunit IIC [Enterococcus asini]
MWVQAFLLGCVAFIGKCDLATGTNLIQRPIVLGPLVGLILGDLEMGIKIGATLELAFLGSYSVGAYIPPNVIVGGVLGTAFAISTGKGVEVAFTMAFPIAMLAMIIDTFFFSIVRPIMGRWADKYAVQGNTRAISVIHMGAGFLTCTVLGVITFLGFSLGSNTMESIVNAIPDVITDGLTIATGLLPGIGFAMLALMIMNKKVVPYYFLGFALSAYLKIPVIGIAILGLILIFITIDFAKGHQIAESEVIEDDDDF